MRTKEAFTLEALAEIAGVPLTTLSTDATDAKDGEGTDLKDDDATDGLIPAYYFETTKDAVIRILQSLMGKTTILDMGIEEQSLEAVIQRIYSDGSMESVDQRNGKPLHV